MTQPKLSPELDQLLSISTVLVVDDATIMRNLEVSYLRDMGFAHTPSAGNGRTALQYIIRNPVDMIICDWDMPDMDGLELLQCIKGDSRLKDIPFLMVTAVSEVAQVKQAIAAGVTDYLTKPFQLEDFGYRVMKMLRVVARNRGEESGQTSGETQ